MMENDIRELFTAPAQTKLAELLGKIDGIVNMVGERDVTVAIEMRLIVEGGEDRSCVKIPVYFDTRIDVEGQWESSVYDKDGQPLHDAVAA